MGGNRILKKCVFLDRDGTIIEDVDYLSTPEGVRILPGAIEGIKLLKRYGFLLIIITNQSGVARGYFTEDDLGAIHERMRSLLEAEGAHYDDLFYCPHHVDGVVEPFNIECDCRKPKTGMLTKAAGEYDIDLGRSFLVGDSERDLEAGKGIGCKTILVETPKNAATDLKEKADFSAHKLLEAAEWIIAQTPGGGG